MNAAAVPKALRAWFVVHFVVDTAVAVPLMLAPVYTLKLLGWQTVDPITARVTAAAFFGIGIESYLSRSSGKEAFLGMLNLKIIWSLAAVIGLGFSLLQGAQESPPVIWFFLLTFAAFNLLWVYWRRKLTR